jgi:murein DD-endopeptidase MepM/ murein hydrolase activator NlpD
VYSFHDLRSTVKFPAGLFGKGFCAADKESVFVLIRLRFRVILRTMALSGLFFGFFSSANVFAAEVLPVSIFPAPKPSDEDLSIENSALPAIETVVAMISSIGVPEYPAAEVPLPRLGIPEPEAPWIELFRPEAPQVEMPPLGLPGIEALPPEIPQPEVPSFKMPSVPDLPPPLSAQFDTLDPPSPGENATTPMPRLTAWEKKPGGMRRLIFFGAGSMQPVDPLVYGELAWPVQGRVSSSFGPRGSGARSRMHAGIDIPVEEGTPILASMAGIVAEAREFNGYGKTIVLSHANGMQTLYAHCSRLLVRQGESVELGEIIACAGKTGRATVSHLHFGVMVSGTFRNPMALLKGRGDRFARRKARDSGL